MLPPEEVAQLLGQKHTPAWPWKWTSGNGTTGDSEQDQQAKAIEPLKVATFEA
jgi:hypothetical protein